jgi:arylsulfatase A-like enzyme
VKIKFAHAILGAVLVALGALVACTATSSQPPNVLLIVVDTLRHDHVGCYGATRDTTPALDALATEAVRFERAYSPAPWTMPAVASMLTGLHPSGHGLTRVGALTGEARTLAEILQQHGYATTGIVSHLLLGARFGFDQGFAEFVESYSATPHHDVSTQRVTRQARQALERMAGQQRPFFLFVHYFDPHYHYKRHAQYGFAPETSGRLDGDETIQELRELMLDLTPDELNFIKALYDEEVRHTDAGVGRLLAALSELDVDRNTLVIVTSDHGEEFLDRGWLGHTRTLYDELVRVPLLIRLPEKNYSPKVSDVPISLTALTPTILDLVGVDSMPFDFQARSFSRMLDAGTTELGGDVLSEVDFIPFNSGKWVREVHKKSVVADRHKVVRDDTTGLVEVYDLADDPGETRNLAPERPELAARLLSRLEEWVAEAGSNALTLEDVLLEEQQIDKLRSLGYVGQ